jgi:hypothetical protein
MNFVSPSGTDPVDSASERGSAIEDAADEIGRTQRICRILLSCLVYEAGCGSACRRSKKLSQQDGSVNLTIFVTLIAPLVFPEVAEMAFDPRLVVMIAWWLPNGSPAIGVPGSYGTTGIIAQRRRVGDLVVGAAA